MLNVNELIQRIEEVRNNHQLSAAAFAAMIGVQRSAMSHILSGRNKPSLEFLMKIYETFEEVQLDWLILGHSSPPLQKNDNDLFQTINDDIKILQTESEVVAANQKIEIENQPSNQPIEGESPKEIVYLYDNGSFERFTPKK